jgi:hypothetical protein
MITKDAQVQHLLGFNMGKNTPERQEFIIGNLKVEKDLVEEAESVARASVVKSIAEKLEANEVEEV